MGTGSDKLRVNPRKSWYSNVEAVTTNGDYEVTFHLKRPQPALLTLLASGWSPIYPATCRRARCGSIRSAPGRSNSSSSSRTNTSRSRKNPDYWKKDRPYLDGIEYTIMREIAPRNLAFFAGKFDVELALRRDPADLEGFRGAGAAGDLRDDRGQCAAHDADQPAQAAVRQSRTASAR